MTQEIIDFINKHENLIDNNRWDECYQEACKFTTYSPYYSIVSELTEVFHSADIHPEEYLTTIPANFAALNEDLKYIDISDSVRYIGQDAFHSCVDLETVKFGNSIKRIEDRAFRYCQRLTEVILPDSVEYIGDNVFDGCVNLTKCVLSKNIKSLGDEIFLGCDKLDTICFRGTKAQWNALNIDEESLEGFTIIFDYEGEA